MPFYMRARLCRFFASTAVAGRGAEPLEGDAFNFLKIKSLFLEMPRYFQTSLINIESSRAPPNMELLSEPSAQAVFIRWTYDDESLNQQFISKYSKYVYAREFSKKQKVHYHAVVVTDDDSETVRAHFREVFPMLNSGHLYNLQQSESIEQSLIYICKDVVDVNDLKFKEFDVNYLKSLCKISYKKFSKESFMKDLSELENIYMLTDMSPEDLLDRFIEIKVVKYNQNPNWNNATGWVDRCVIRKTTAENRRMLCSQRWDRYMGYNPNWK